MCDLSPVVGSFGVGVRWSGLVVENSIFFLFFFPLFFCSSLSFSFFFSIFCS